MASGRDRGGGGGIAWAANARNNAEALPDRRAQWTGARDAAWRLLESIVEQAGSSARVCVVGAGNADDLPLERLARSAGHVDLVDIDPDAALRGAARLPADLRGRVGLVEQDVTGGGADRVLVGARRGWGAPRRLPRMRGPVGAGGYDVVVADLVYTQLLHPGLVALGLPTAEQARLMQRWDQPLVESVVVRIHGSLAPGGVAVHLHDLACWSPVHQQPITLDAALDSPDERWRELLRHDGTDPWLAAHRLGLEVEQVAWWRWPFRPDKSFLVRATVTRARAGA